MTEQPQTLRDAIVYFADIVKITNRVDFTKIQTPYHIAKQTPGYQKKSQTPM